MSWKTHLVRSNKLGLWYKVILGTQLFGWRLILY